jgi:hypothetical protein
LPSALPALVDALAKGLYSTDAAGGLDRSLGAFGAAMPRTVSARPTSPCFTSLTRLMSTPTRVPPPSAPEIDDIALQLFQLVEEHLAHYALIFERKPTFGKRRCSGIWPPSKPA